ncbi:TaqI-like C-terminal specificity domain-containing protein [Deferribacterales bacterium RsTz2092]|nr:N-6 DNA methylase [Deferribacterales bacterium]
MNRGEVKLAVSYATMNNWHRLGVASVDVSSRLSRRANKRYSTKNILPAEYIKNTASIIQVNAILNFININNIASSDAIYSIALNLLQKYSLLSGNPFLESILDEFSANICEELLTCPLPQDETDILGVIYQSILKEGDKNKKGSYYTPDSVIKSLDVKVGNGDKILDPCCGTGSFLLSFADKVSAPTLLYGVDIDPIACFIAKINLIIRFKHIMFSPNIFNADFLMLNSTSKFDIIATNPPWGALPSDEYKLYFGREFSNESFSYFIVKATEFLKSSGRCFFVLPISVLNVQAHRAIRRYILDNFSVENITLLGKVFNGVLTDIVSISLSNLRLDKNILEIHNGKDVMFVEQSAFEADTNYNFSIISRKDDVILRKIFDVPHKTLAQSVWGLGIVTGNNEIYISKDKSVGERIYTGKEINKFLLKESNKYIDYKRDNFQQVAADNIYRAKEKLFYKFISKNLTFAYDNTQSLSLNSANILIPNIAGYSIKAVMALLNSALFQYIYNKKFGEIKILKSNLLQLPFPILHGNENERLTYLVDRILSEKTTTGYIEQIDELVFSLFRLDKQEIARTVLR